jgi:hypothetical protein
MEEPTAWVVFVGGCALAVPYGRACIVDRVDAREFGSFIEKLLFAGNVPRAMKLASCADMPLLRATRAVLERSMGGGDALGDRSTEPGDYRSPGALRDPASARDALSATFVRTFDAGSRARRRARVPAVLAACLWLALVAAQIAGASADLPLLCACFALLVLGGFARMDLRLRADALGMYVRLEETFLSVAMNPPEQPS